MKWFDGRETSDINMPESLRVDVEEVLDLPCVWCDEAVGITDCGFLIPTAEDFGAPIGRITMDRPWHMECKVRHDVGPAEHLQKQMDGNPCSDPCSCADNEFQTKREAAYEAFKIVSGGAV